MWQEETSHLTKWMKSGGERGKMGKIKIRKEKENIEE